MFILFNISMKILNKIRQIQNGATS